MRHVASVLFTVALTACGAHTAQSPPRSPSHDYPPPEAQTSNGEVVGADRVPPSDKLETGARVGTGGVVPAEGPGGGREQTHTGTQVPCKQIGLEDESGESRCGKGNVQGQKQGGSTDGERGTGVAPAR